MLVLGYPVFLIYLLPVFFLLTYLSKFISVKSRSVSCWTATILRTYILVLCIVWVMSFHSILIDKYVCNIMVCEHPCSVDNRKRDLSVICCYRGTNLGCSDFGLVLPIQQLYVLKESPQGDLPLRFKLNYLNTVCKIYGAQNSKPQKSIKCGNNLSVLP